MALGLEQAGRLDEALSAFEDIAKASPPDAPWMELIRQHIAASGGDPVKAGTAGELSQSDIAAVESLSDGDQQELIRSMVDGLAARLQENPNDLAGWLQLIRSYSVLGDKEKALEALKSGLETFPADSSEGQQLMAISRKAGLAVDGVTQ